MAGGALWDRRERTVEEQALCSVAVRNGNTPQPDTSPHNPDRDTCTYIPLLHARMGPGFRDTAHSHPLRPLSSPQPWRKTERGSKACVGPHSWNPRRRGGIKGEGGGRDYVKKKPQTLQCLQFSLLRQTDVKDAGK